MDITNAPAAVRRVAHLLCLGLALGVPATTRAQDQGAPGWVTDSITSPALGRRAVLVATPEGYGHGKLAYPVLVLLDANDERMFRLWIAQAAYLADNRGGFPAVIAVGIPNGSDRIHDMTPPATGSSVADFENAGGASAFADFIIDEVLPWVRTRYRTLPSTILVGHSAGGLFAAGVAARRPDEFNGIIATSPALWFNDQTLVPLYADLMGKSRTHPRLFVASGGGEPEIEAACVRLAELLGANPALSGRFLYRHYPEATHQLTPMSVGDGLQFIFEPVTVRNLAIHRLNFATVDATTLKAALRSSDSAYAINARSLGLSEALPENVINALGYDLLGEHKASLAVSVFLRNVRAYPASVNVYDSLADGYLAAADSASALTQLRKAVEVAGTNGVPVPAETQRKLNALEGK